MRVADFCLVMCGDTPTSRRIFDAIVADCIPLIVGTRLWGRCEAPCHEGWGWFVSGKEHPHLPFRDTYVGYTRFPRVDEKLLYEDVISRRCHGGRGAGHVALPEAIRDASFTVWKSPRHLHGVCSMAWRSRRFSTNSTVAMVDFHTGRLWIWVALLFSKFGRAAANLMDGVMLRRLHQGLGLQHRRPEGTARRSGVPSSTSWTANQISRCFSTCRQTALGAVL